MKIKMDVEIELPALPNGIKCGGVVIPISEIESSVLQSIGDEWTKALIVKAKSKKPEDQTSQDGSRKPNERPRQNHQW